MDRRTGIADGAGGDSTLRGRAAPAELLALAFSLEEREELDVRERRRLDREIGREGSALGALALLRRWLSLAPSEALRTRAARLRSWLSRLDWGLGLLGAVLGWGAAAALLSFETQGGRVSLIATLAFLVWLPALTWLLAWVGLLAAVRGRRDDDSAPYRPTLWRGLLGGLLLRVVPARTREDLEILVGRIDGRQRLYAEVQRAQLFVWSQTLGLGFSLAALVTTLGFVVFTDLAFGWSTTLDVETASVHGLLRGLAWPFAAIWPEAQPSLELVEATRFFRVASQGAAGPIDPIVYGGWWPYLVASIGCYAVLPRLVTWIVARVVLQRSTVRAMALTPGVDRLLDDLRMPLVETAAERPEAELDSPRDGLVPCVDLGEVRRAAGGTPLRLIRWAELLDEASLRSALDGLALAIDDAGGRRTLAEDESLVRQVARGEGAVALGVRGFEPPVLEILDYLTALRRGIGVERRLFVFLFGGAEAHLDTWRRKLTTLGDPALAVFAHAASGATPGEAEVGDD